MKINSGLIATRVCRALPDAVRMRTCIFTPMISSAWWTGLVFHRTGFLNRTLSGQLETILIFPVLCWRCRMIRKNRVNFCLLKGVQFMKTGHSHAVPIHWNMRLQEPVMKINAKSATSSPTTPTASAIKNLVNGQSGSGLKTSKYNYIMTWMICGLILTPSSEETRGALKGSKALG